jgi:hypothetical protein
MLLICVAPLTFAVLFNAGSDGSTNQPFVRRAAEQGQAQVHLPAVFWPSLASAARARAMATCAAVWFTATLGLRLTCLIAFVPDKWALPAYLLPWLPSASTWLLIMMLGGFGGRSSDFECVGWAVLALCALFLGYSVHASFYRFTDGAFSKAAPTEGAPHAEDASNEQVRDQRLAVHC